jgi:hypothetical protein
MTAEIPELLSAVEGLAPEAVAAIEAYIKGKETELKATLEEHYGVKPVVLSDPRDSTTPIQDAVSAAPAPQDATPTSPAVPVTPVTQDATVQALLQRMASLEQQLAEEKSKRENPETISVGSGDPVPHTLFLNDGSVIKNHGGIATTYTTTNTDGTEYVRKVVAAYPA